MISGLLENIKRLNTSVIKSEYVQNLCLNNYVFDSQHHTWECLIHILTNAFFLNIDQSMFQIRLIESTTCEITNTPEYGCGSNCSLKEVNSQYLVLDVEDPYKLRSVQGLLDLLFDSHDQSVPDYFSENCNKVISFNCLKL